MEYEKTDMYAVCLKAATKFYEAGRRYNIYRDKTGLTYVKGSDGLFDRFDSTLSRFSRIKDANQ